MYVEDKKQPHCVELTDYKWKVLEEGGIGHDRYFGEYDF